MTSVDAKLLRQTKFPPEFSQKVDMTKVNIEVMKKWIAGKISDILGSEDDVVIELCFNLLEGDRFPDIKRLQIQLTGFLDKDTAKFCKDLWNLCLSAQNSPQGVPKELLEAKKLELMQEKIDAEKASTSARLRADRERQRELKIDGLRKRERVERHTRAPEGSDIPRRYNEDRNSDHRRSWRRPRDQERSHSPKPRDSDTYKPRARERRTHDERARRASRSPYRRRRNSSAHSTQRNRGPYSSSTNTRSPSPRPHRKRRDFSRSPTLLSRSPRGRTRTDRSESLPRKRRTLSSSSAESTSREKR